MTTIELIIRDNKGDIYGKQIDVKFNRTTKVLAEALYGAIVASIPEIEKIAKLEDFIKDIS